MIIGPGATVGILGGGQLGRMLAMAAARLGLRTHIYAPEPDSPAAEVSAQATIAPYDDRNQLAAFAQSVDVITYEFENVPADTATFLAGQARVLPGPAALEVAQDRLKEKLFLAEQGIATTAFAHIASREDLETALDTIGTPAILKTRRMGYDGKGQATIAKRGDADAAYHTIRKADAILEGFVDFEREVSVIIARAQDGTLAAYDPSHNVHRHHILHTSTVPAGLSADQEQAAKDIAARIATALNYVGVMGVELFLTRSGALLVNEIAPRVHNSGHWTLDGCHINQFEQHIRAICGWSLGSTERHANAVMTNLVGADVETWSTFIGEPNTVLHLYGKDESRAGRKMGHVTRLFPLEQDPKDP